MMGRQAPVTPPAMAACPSVPLDSAHPGEGLAERSPSGDHWGPHPRPTLHSSYRPPGLGLQRRSYCVQCDNCVFFSRFRNCSLGHRALR